MEKEKVALVTANACQLGAFNSWSALGFVVFALQMKELGREYEQFWQLSGDKPLEPGFH